MYSISSTSAGSDRGHRRMNQMSGSSIGACGGSGNYKHLTKSTSSTSSKLKQQLSSGQVYQPREGVVQVELNEVINIFVYLNNVFLL